MKCSAGCRARLLVLAIWGLGLLASNALAQAGNDVDVAQLARVRAAEAARVRLVERLAPAVVCIFPKGNRNGGGSGVLIHPEGYGLTNYHVVASLGAGREGQGGMSDGKLYPLEVLGIDPAGDIAMFKLKRAEPLAGARGSEGESVAGASGLGDRAFAYVPIGDSAVMTAGDWTLAMGNPFLLAEDYKPTVTFGIVSGNHRYLAGSGRALIYTDCIAVDTSINPGNSGGPLFNMAGELVGINGRIGIEERGRVNVGVGYSVGVNQIRRFMPALRAGLVTKHATLGATVYDKAYREVCVDQILETSGAYKAGLRLGDRVLACNGVEIHSANALMNLVGSCPAEWPAELRVRRAAEGASPVERTLRFRLEALPLPKAPRPPHGMPEESMAGMLTGPNDDANIREVRRTLTQARAALGGDEAAAATRGWTMTPTRVLAAGGAPRTQEVAESRACVDSLDKAAASLEPQALETAARWSLIAASGEARRSQWKIIGSDDVRGRVAILLERTCDDGRRFTLSLDDATGELLRVGFDDPATHKAVRYDYADYRREGPLRLPHRRTLYLDEERFAEDVVSGYELKGGGGN